MLSEVQFLIQEQQFLISINRFLLCFQHKFTSHNKRVLLFQPHAELSEPITGLVAELSEPITGLVTVFVKLSLFISINFAIVLIVQFIIILDKLFIEVNFSIHKILFV